MTARRLVGAHPTVEVPAGGRMTIAADGSVFSAAMVNGNNVYTMQGDVVRRFDRRYRTIVLGPDASWVAACDERRLVKLDVASGEVLAEVPLTSRDGHSLHYEAGFLYTRDRVWRASDLEPAALPNTNIPSPSYRVRALSSRFVVSAFRRGLVLWDRIRDRSVLWHDLFGAEIGTVLDARLALVMGARQLHAIDFVTNTQLDVPAVQARRPDIAFVASRTHAIVGYGTAYRSQIYALAWGETLPPGDLETAWDDRDPILDNFPDTGEHALDMRIARGHPRLEVAFASKLPPGGAMRWLRRALRDPQQAARPGVWAQLAAAALACGDRDAAADACAEGLGRDEHDEALYALLARARQPRE